MACQQAIEDRSQLGVIKEMGWRGFECFRLALLASNCSGQPHLDRE